MQFMVVCVIKFFCKFKRSALGFDILLKIMYDVGMRHDIYNTWRKT